MKRFYWLKLKEDFFDRNEIKIIEDRENGKDYILFYLKLLLKSISTGGMLRVTDRIPFDEKTLASITNTNIDVVRTAIKVFCEFSLMEITEEHTIYMPEVENMTGAECDSAQRVRKFRHEGSKKALHCNSEVTKCNTDIDIELEKEKEIEIELEKEFIGNDIQTLLRSLSFKDKLYPYDEKKDIHFINDLQNEFPAVNIASVIKNYKLWLDGNGRKTKTEWNPRLQIRNWVIKDAEKRKEVNHGIHNDTGTDAEADVRQQIDNIIRSSRA